MGKALKTVGVIIGAAALIATGVGALAMPALAGTTTLFGVSVGTLNTISSGLVAVGGMLDKPKSQGSASPDEWTSNPDQPTPFLMGRMGIAGKIVQRDEFGPDNMYQGIVGVLSGAGPIRGVTSFAGDKQPVTFGANGIAISSQWQGEMWMVRRAGNQPDTVLSVPPGLKSGGEPFEWSTAAKLSGKACYLQILGENSKGTAFPAGIPDPVHTAEGIFGYDPRYDDTYPGGAGPCRLGVRSTYRWIENGGIGALNWALGLVENGQVVGGIGASIDGIDVPAFVEVANIADANSWILAAWPDTSEDVSAVLDQLLQAAGAVRARHAGKISCVSRGAPRASVATITARDTAGDIELDTAPSLFNRLNTITPRFMSEAAGWVLTPANPVSFAQYVSDDGGKHGDLIDYRFVPLLKQAAELAAYDILDAREPFSGTIPLKPHMRHLKRGDTFDIDEPGFLMHGVKCIVLSRSYDPKTAQVRIGFRSETDSKHALALGKTTTLPDFPTLTPTDPTLVSPPLPEDWVITPRPPGPGGTLVPGFDLSGAVGNSTATAIEVQWWEVPDGVDPMAQPPADAKWQSAGTWPPTASDIPINVPGGRYYWIGLIHVRNQNYSERTVVGPWLAGKLIADDVSQEARDKLVNKVIEDVGTQIGEGIEAGKKALERSKGNLLLTLRNAKNALDGTLKEEADREAQTGDLQDRIDIGFLIDPVAKTGIIREDVVVEGTGETFVQMNTRLVARDDENALQTAQVVIDAQAYTDREISLATANLVAAAQMETAISAALLSMEAYADAAAASATTGLASVAQVDSRIAAANLLLRGYVDQEIVEATTGLASLVQVDNKVAAADLALRSWTAGQIVGATAGLASVAQVDDKVGVASLQLQGMLNAYKVEASGVFATQSSLGGVSSQAGLALATAAAADGKASATIGLASTVDGLLTGIFSHNDGLKPWIRVQSSVFEVVDNAVTGERFEIAGKRVKGWYANGQQAYQLG